MLVILLFTLSSCSGILYQTKKELERTVETLEDIEEVIHVLEDEEKLIEEKVKKFKKRYEKPKEPVEPDSDPLPYRKNCEKGLFGLEYCKEGVT